MVLPVYKMNKIKVRPNKKGNNVNDDKNYIISQQKQWPSLPQTETLKSVDKSIFTNCEDKIVHLKYYIIWALFFYNNYILFDRLEKYIHRLQVQLENN